MVDAHCHIYESKVIGDEVLGFRKIGGTHMLCCGGDLASSIRSAELAQEYPEIYASVGVHPEHVKSLPEVDDFLKLVQGKVVAIGECGLDYYKNTGIQEKKFQEDLLRFNIDLAEKTNLPLVVHCRAAFDDLFETLHYDKVQMHCFTGNLEQMQECVHRSWYISFGGILTFKSGVDLREVAKQTPADRLLVETDSPYLAPEPVRGSINEPKNVKIVAETLAEVRGTTLAEIEKITVENFRKLFSI